MNTLSNTFQLLGTILQALAFLIVFLNKKSQINTINYNGIIEIPTIYRNASIGDEDNYERYLEDILKTLIIETNKKYKEIFNQLNTPKFFTKISWFMLALGFIFQVIGLV